MAKKVYDNQQNVVEKSPQLLGLYVHSPGGHRHELYVEKTPAGATIFECATCDYFKQVPRDVSDERLVTMQYAIVGYLQRHDPDNI